MKMRSKRINPDPPAITATPVVDVQKLSPTFVPYAVKLVIVNGKSVDALLSCPGCHSLRTSVAGMNFG
jgi:hypothetical protein